MFPESKPAAICCNWLQLAASRCNGWDGLAGIDGARCRGLECVKFTQAGDETARFAATGCNWLQLLQLAATAATGCKCCKCCKWLQVAANWFDWV
jgi:hypothetical protein